MRLEDREVRQRREQQPGHDDRLAADPVRQRAEHDEERRAEQQRAGDHQVRRRGVDLQRLRQEEQRVELAGVPHHRLPGGEAEQREQHDLEVAPLAERLRSAAPSRSCPRPSSAGTAGDSLSLSRIHTETPSSTSETRNGMRQPQASNASVPIESAAGRGSRAATGRGRASPSSGSTTCRRRACPAARARRRRSPRRRTRRRARGPAAGAGRSGSPARRCRSARSWAGCRR